MSGYIKKSEIQSIVNDIYSRISIKYVEYLTVLIVRSNIPYNVNVYLKFEKNRKQYFDQCYNNINALLGQEIISVSLFNSIVNFLNSLKSLIDTDIFYNHRGNPKKARNGKVTFNITLPTIGQHQVISQNIINRLIETYNNFLNIDFYNGGYK